MDLTTSTTTVAPLKTDEENILELKDRFTTHLDSAIKQHNAMMSPWLIVLVALISLAAFAGMCFGGYILWKKHNEKKNRVAIVSVAGSTNIDSKI
jgi:hypothetical protein